MTAALIVAVLIVAVYAGATYLMRREPGTDWLTDTAPYIAPDEPWPGYVPRGPERRRHWLPGTDAYDIQNVIRKAWRDE